MDNSFVTWSIFSLPIIITELGQWWGTDSRERKQVQINLVGASAEGNEYLIGSCKYRNEKIGTDELELLRYYVSVFNKGSKYYYYIFSKGGFTEELLEREREGEVTLLSLDDLF